MTLQRNLSTNPEAIELCVCVCVIERVLCVQSNRCCVVWVSVLHRGQYGEVCVFAWCVSMI